MVILTILGKDDTKQITNMNNVVMSDHKNKALTNEKLSAKISEIAMTIGGKNYKSHKFELN